MSNSSTINTISRNNKSFLFLLFSSCLLLLATTEAATTEAVNRENENHRLKIEVFYEALCPDSMRFIKSQLAGAMLDNNWLQYTDLEFIPYGKVSSWTDRSNVTHLYCQHGERECELNALHACICENNNIEEQMHMIRCMMRGYRTDVDACAKNLNIDIKKAKECKETRKTSDILKKYGDQTDAFDFTFVPFITVDGVFSTRQQHNLLYDFPTVFCDAYKTKFEVSLDKC